MGVDRSASEDSDVCKSETEEIRTEFEGVILIVLISCLCSFLVIQFFASLGDIVLMPIAVLFGIWTGVKKPMVSARQIRVSWIIGGLVAFLLVIVQMMRNGGPLSLMIRPFYAEVAVCALWTIAGVPTVGIVSALRGRAMLDGFKWKEALSLFGVAVLITGAPYAVTRIPMGFR